jgi:hypothetical protein
MHHDGMTVDDEPSPTDVRVFDRLLAAGLSLERVEAHLTAGRVYVDGELVTDPYRPAPPPFVFRSFLALSLVRGTGDTPVTCG